MEELDESEQTISVGRQEFRKRKQPSQPMVDKSQQTEAAEKKKHMAPAPSSGPKATLSIGNIPGSKDNYPDTQRVSSQLQQTWMKRKHGQEMNDKSLQTEVALKEKKEAMVSCTLDKPAGIAEVAPGFSENIQEVEIPPNRHVVKIVDRAQQTSCTGDWASMNICLQEKVDKEQQTSSSKTDMVMSRPSSSSEAKEGAQQIKSSGSNFVSEQPEQQPTTSYHEEIGLQSASQVSLIQDTGIDIPALSEDDSVAKEVSAVDIMELLMENVSANISAIEEATAKEESSLVEESATPVQPPTGETLETATAPVEASEEIQPPPAEEPPSFQPPVEFPPTSVQKGLSEKPFDTLESQVAEVAPSEELPAEIMVPPTEEEIGEVQPLTTEGVLEEFSGQVESTTLGEATEEGQLLPSEEAPEESPTEVFSGLTEETHLEEVDAELQSPPVEEAPGEKAHAEIQPLPTEEVPAEVQPPPAEEAPIEEAPVEVPIEDQLLPAEEAPIEEAPVEVPIEDQLLPAEEDTIEEAPVEVLIEDQLLPAEEAPIEEAPVEVPIEDQLLPVKEDTIEEAPVEVPTEDQLLPAEEAPIEEAPVEVPTEDQLLPAEEDTIEEAPVEVLIEDQLLPAEEDTIEEAPVEVLIEDQLLPAEEDTIEEAPVEVPVEDQLLSAEEDTIEEAPVEVLIEDQLLPAEEDTIEEATIDSQPLSAEEVSIEQGPAEVQPPSAEDSPVEEIPEEAQLPSADNAPLEGTPAEIQSPPAEVVSKEDDSAATDLPPAEETPAEVQFPQAEEPPAEGQLSAGEGDSAEEKGDSAKEEALVDHASTEIQPGKDFAEGGLVELEALPAEEAPPTETKSPLPGKSFGNEMPVEVHFLRIEEITAGEAPTAGQPPGPLDLEEKGSAEGQPLPDVNPGEEDLGDMQPLQEVPVQEMPADLPPPPSEQTPTDNDPAKDVATEQTAGTSEKASESTPLTGDKKHEEKLPTSEAGSNQISTFKIEGIIQIELKKPS